MKVFFLKESLSLAQQGMRFTDAHTNFEVCTLTVIEK